MCPKLKCDFCGNEVDFLLDGKLIKDKICYNCFTKLLKYFNDHPEEQEIFKKKIKKILAGT